LKTDGCLDQGDAGKLELRIRKTRKCAGHHSRNQGMINNERHPHLPHARPDPAPSAPRRLGVSFSYPQET
jgi:hypothetical protein